MSRVRVSSLPPLYHLLLYRGFFYLSTKNKMYNSICNDFTNDEVIISALLLRDHLYSI
ncbi:hypothetical protein [Streptobacillus moniliformis]|uniref:hypothetical protein n=1 Tax=Streptobacillus moniliformis TaxID=34105 RepID=UPI0012DA9667